MLGGTRLRAYFECAMPSKAVSTPSSFTSDSADHLTSMVLFPHGKELEKRKTRGERLARCRPKADARNAVQAHHSEIQFTPSEERACLQAEGPSVSGGSAAGEALATLLPDRVTPSAP